MHTRVPRTATAFAVAVFAFSLLFAAAALSRSAAQTKRPSPGPAAPAAKTVIFAVSKYETNVSMEPVVTYSRGVYTKPPIDGDEATIKTFVDEYFKPGRQY